MVQLVQPCLAKDIQRHFACKYSIEPQGVREPCKLGAMHSRGSSGRGSICDSGISASEAALAGGVGELSEPLAANRLQFMSTYFYMWSLMQ